MKKLILFNNKGLIIVCLYINKNGNLHSDSWICPKGWK